MLACRPGFTRAKAALFEPCRLGLGDNPSREGQGRPGSAALPEENYDDHYVGDRNISKVGFITGAFQARRRPTSDILVLRKVTPNQRRTQL